MVGSDNGPRPRPAIRPAAEKDAEAVARIYNQVSVFATRPSRRRLATRTPWRGVYEKHAQLDGRWLDVVIVEKLIAENQP